MSIGMEEKEKVWLGLIETKIQNSNGSQDSFSLWHTLILVQPSKFFVKKIFGR